MQAPRHAKNAADAAQANTAGTVTQKRVLADSRREAVALLELAGTMQHSPRALQQRSLENAMHNSPRMVAQRNRMHALVGMPGVVQCRAGTLAVTTARHPGSAAQVPHDAAYNFGFLMDVALDIDQPFQYSTLQENFALTQYVSDQYEFWLGVEDDAATDAQAPGNWERDEYGAEDDGGDWHSDGASTSWQDAPGWNGNHHAAAGYLLNTYAAEFYFTVGDGDGGILHTSDAIRLSAESDDNDTITYTTANINEAVNYDPA